MSKCVVYYSDEPTEWIVVRVEDSQLESKLNSYQKEGWNIFQIIPVPVFQDHKVMMVTVPLPVSLQYDLVLRRNKE